MRAEEAGGLEGLWVSGASAAVHVATEDDASSQLVAHLGLLLDRFDGRILLDDLAQHESRLGDADGGDEEGEEGDEDLDHERFRSLRALRDLSAQEAATRSKIDDAAAQLSSVLSALRSLGIPADVALPDSARGALLLLHAAKSVREKGVRLEILLRSQHPDHGSDAQFSFLHPQSALYACFEFVKRLPDEAFWPLYLQRLGPTLLTSRGEGVTEGKEGGEKDGEESDGAVWRRGGLLDSDCDADRPWGQPSAAQRSRRRSLEEAGAVRKERRQRARQLQGHFLRLTRGDAATPVCVPREAADHDRVLRALGACRLDLPGKVRLALQLLTDLPAAAPEAKEAEAGEIKKRA